MSRINMVNCDECKKRCDNSKDSYFQITRFDYIGEEFIEDSLNEDLTTLELEDYEKHFCSLKCLREYYKKNE